jgi:chromosome segregation ATPase
MDKKYVKDIFSTDEKDRETAFIRSVKEAFPGYTPPVSEVANKKKKKTLHNTTITFTQEERDYLDDLVRETGTNRHQVTATLLRLHGRKVVSYLNLRDERDNARKKCQILESSCSSLENGLADMRKELINANQKIEELEKENKELKAAVSSTSGLKDIDIEEKEKEREKSKSFFKRLGGI